MNKSEQRLKAKEISVSLSENYIRYADERITTAIIQSDSFAKCNNLFVYVSMDKEPNTLEIINNALCLGKNVFVPKCISDCEMLAVKINSLDELSVGKMGIKEPKNIAVTALSNEIDLAIVPCVAATRDGKRLGHGAGYYDRFLSGAVAEKICLCYDKLIFDSLPTTPLDIIMDSVVTENY